MSPFMLRGCVRFESCRRFGLGAITVLLLLAPLCGIAMADDVVQLLSIHAVPAGIAAAPAVRPEGVGPAKAAAVLAKRSAPVSFNPAVSDRSAAARGTVLAVPDFEGRQHRVLLDVVEERGGIALLRGRAEECELGHFVMSTKEGLSLASLRLPRRNREYYIAYDHERAEHLMYEIALDEKPQPRLRGPISPPRRTGSPEGDGQMLAFDAPVQPLMDPPQSGLGDPAVIDVLVLYTPAAAAWAEANATSIDHAVNLVMADGQTAMDNSLTAVTLNLVGAHEVEYVESWNVVNDLYRLTYTGTYTDWKGLDHTCSPFMDEVHALRDELGADLVTLLVNHEWNMPGGLGASGIAWAYRSEHHPEGVPEWGFSVSEIYYYRNYVHIHEIGHNLGAGHHKRQSMQKGPQLFHYSAGWRFSLSGDWYNTVMAYTWGYPEDLGGPAISTRVPYFSSPLISIGSPPVQIGGSEDADNAFTILNTKHIVAGYRPSLQDLPPEFGGIPNPFLTAAAEAPNWVRLSWSRNTYNDDVMLVWSPDGAFGIPVNGIAYGEGSEIPGGGTVLYRGHGTMYVHFGLSPFTPYYYRAFSCDADFNYSIGSAATATTVMWVETFPWTETFEDDSPSRDGWTRTGSYHWTYDRGAGSGGLALRTNAYEGVKNARFVGSANAHIGRLVTPVLNIAGLHAPQLSFWYAQQVWGEDQNELKVYYRTGPLVAWELLFHDATNRPTWTEATLPLPNPSAQYQIAFEGLDKFGRPNVLDAVTVWSEPEPVADLVVESLTVSPKVSTLGTELTATVVIANHGDLDISTHFFTDFYQHLPIAPRPGDEGDATWQTFDLDAGATRTFTKTFTPAAAGAFAAWAQVDTTRAVSDRSHVLGPYLYYVDQPTGSLRVDIEPNSARRAGAQWRLTTGLDTTWKTSGELISNIPTGDYTITFLNLEEWHTPGDLPVTIEEDVLRRLDAVYNPRTGELGVTLQPAGVRDAGARWRLESGPDTEWKQSGETIEALPVGKYLLLCDDVPGWETPPETHVDILAARRTEHVTNYRMHTGEVQVFMTPRAAREDGAQWRLTSGPNTTWRASGDRLRNLPVGDYTVSFRPLSGWTAPGNMAVVVTDQTLSIREGVYTQQTGSVRVTIEPAAARDAGARWRLTQGPDIGWKASGETIEDLPVGEYSITFNSLAAWRPPEVLSVTIKHGALAPREGTYTQRTGNLEVVIEPRAARDAGAQWRLTSGPDTGWKHSGQRLLGLPVGEYTITFSEIERWVRPIDIGVYIAENLSLSRSGTYIEGSPSGPYQLIYTAGAGGAIVGETPQTVPHGMHGTPVEAIPEEGAGLIRWSDGILTTARQDSNVTRDLSVVAHFMSAGGVPIEWYAGHGIEPGPGETWAEVDQRHNPAKEMTLLQEYVAFTDPSQMGSVFKIIEIGPATPLSVVFQPDSPDRLYTLQYRPNLTEGDWLNVPGQIDIPGASGPLIGIESDEPVFYRVLVRLP